MTRPLDVGHRASPARTGAAASGPPAGRGAPPPRPGRAASRVPSRKLFAAPLRSRSRSRPPTLRSSTTPCFWADLQERMPGVHVGRGDDQRVALGQPPLERCQQRRGVRLGRGHPLLADEGRHLPEPVEVGVGQGDAQLLPPGLGRRRTGHGGIHLRRAPARPGPPAPAAGAPTPSAARPSTPRAPFPARPPGPSSARGTPGRAPAPPSGRGTAAGSSARRRSPAARRASSTAKLRPVAASGTSACASASASRRTRNSSPQQR